MQPKLHPAQLKQKFSSIIQKPSALNVKLMLLQAFKQHLQEKIDQTSHQNQIEKEQKKLDQTRAFFNGSSLIEDQENLISNILSKQKKKIELDEDLETVADDLFEIEKVIETKRKFDEQLTLKIQIKTQTIDSQRKKLMNQTVRGENTKLKLSKSTGFLQKIFG